ncbi:nucleoside-diphosphate-sugar epimerase [Nocardioides luteus]|uniref:dTDP-glucose 4,6-dehydratase n=1 Tax=Nocardioides luteus TaxID=1844 RepID=A0ABQ5ST67_9ACTN|nr:NAD(P)-dependent oxidoreductase [Nocardioides luteus]MDR7310113.1 nucleoside-diphosphate-sugar epimerase [Nocardioides luteus]GGR64709.1 dTDP-glucose 4,6-dehydratase [Nocardioides luteus]GLJ66979.1 dTDP-glucose 4,6-dehydratase [Nocardioides luteus]
MRIFIAGGTGAVGTRMVPLLVAAGHQVYGSTRHDAGCERLAAMGANGVVMDPLDADSVRVAVAVAKPEVVVHQLTALGSLSGNLKKWDEEFAVTNRLRTEATDHLMAAARANGVRRVVAQSFGGGWTLERTGGWVKDETAPLIADPGKEARATLAAIRHLEEAVTAPEAGVEGLVLRYGNFYGPGNATSREGAIGELLRKGRMPVVGGGTGVWSFVHIDDVASATVAAIERGAPGIYNIVDDEPAPVNQWMPHLAEQVGGRTPMRLPAWLARPMIGEFGVAVMTSVRGSSNAKAKQELGWSPSYATWRDGFRTGIG